MVQVQGRPLLHELGLQRVLERPVVPHSLLVPTSSGIDQYMFAFNN
jgi:hypothetical protein